MNLIELSAVVRGGTRGLPGAAAARRRAEQGGRATLRSTMPRVAMCVARARAALTLTALIVEGAMLGRV
jgi:hypothetical protein